MIFNKSKANSDDNFMFYLGPNSVELSTECTHLGILRNSQLKSINRTTEMCRKERNAYFAINGIGSSLQQLDYKNVIPATLYGCEVGTNQTSDIDTLNKFQHCVVKHIQKLPQYTRSDMAESLCNLFPINGEISKRKLLFFGKLCNMDCSILSKKIFITRLHEFVIGSTIHPPRIYPRYM